MQGACIAAAHMHQICLKSEKLSRDWNLSFSLTRNTQNLEIIASVLAYAFVDGTHKIPLLYQVMNIGEIRERIINNKARRK